VERLLHALAEDPRILLLWLDEAHELPEETLAEARAITESDLAGTGPIQVLLIGLPKLRAQLQAQCCFPRYSAKPFLDNFAPDKIVFAGLFGIDVRTQPDAGAGDGLIGIG